MAVPLPVLVRLPPPETTPARVAVPPEMARVPPAPPSTTALSTVKDAPLLLRVPPLSVRVPEESWSSLEICRVPPATLMPPDMPASLLALVSPRVPLPVLLNAPLPARALPRVTVSPAPLLSVRVVPPPRLMVPPVINSPLAASVSSVRLSPMLRLPARLMVCPARAPLKTMVWLPVASAAAIATASLKLTPLPGSMVAVSVALVT